MSHILVSVLKETAGKLVLRKNFQPSYKQYTKNVNLAYDKLINFYETGKYDDSSFLTRRSFNYVTAYFCCNLRVAGILLIYDIFANYISEISLEQKIYSSSGPSDFLEIVLEYFQ